MPLADDEARPRCGAQWLVKTRTTALMSTVPTWIAGLALLVSTNALPEPPAPAASSPTDYAAKRAQEISRAEQQLAALKANRRELDELAEEVRLFGGRGLPERLQRAIDANAAAIVETEALLSRLRSKLGS